MVVETNRKSSCVADVREVIIGRDTVPDYEQIINIELSRQTGGEIEFVDEVNIRISKLKIKIKEKESILMRLSSITSRISLKCVHFE